MNWLNKHKVWIMLLVSVLFSYWLIGDNLKSKWWIIDDHEIMAQIGTSYRLSPGKWWYSLKNSEAFKPGLSPRYRPVYYALRFTEMMLWGKNPFLWYLTRFCIFSFSLFVVVYLTSKFSNSLLGLLISIYFATLSFWPEMVLRLGPAETYAVLGLSLFALFYYKILILGQSYLRWFGLLIGYVFMAGSKENFIVFMFLWIVLLIYLIAKKIRLSLVGIIFSIFSVLFTVLVAYAVINVSRKGIDIYGQSTSSSSRIQLVNKVIVELAVDNRFYIPTFLIIFVNLVCFSYNACYQKKNNFKVLYWSISLLLFCLFLYVSQYVFYNGVWPQGNRYDFPGTIVVLGLWFLCISVLNFVLNVKLVMWFFTILILPVIFNNIEKLNGLRFFAIDNFNRTNMFTASIIDVSSKINSGQCNVMLITDTPWDYEPVLSIRSFLNAYSLRDFKYYISPLFCDRYVGDQYMPNNLKKIICDWKVVGSENNIDPMVLKRGNLCCVGLGKYSDKDCESYTELPYPKW